MHAGYFFGRRAQLTPDREALLEVANGRRYTYVDLDRRACRTANWLQELGVGLGDPVALLAHNGVLYVDLLLACAKIGAVFTPLNWRLAPAELTYILDDCTPRVLIAGPEFEAKVKTPEVQKAVAHLVRQQDYEAAVAKRPSGHPPQPEALNGESPLCILYTSGTTGRPKGALIPHRQVLWNAINTAISWECTAADVAPIFTPMFHAGGLFVFLTPLFYLGGRVIVAREFDRDASLQLIARERCTVVLGVPTQFREWLQSPDLSDVDLSAMRWFISGGAPCPASLIAAWQKATGCVLRQGYGLTEVGPNCFTMRDDEAVTRQGSVGKPVMHSQVQLVDGDGRPVAAGETGELLIRGPHVSNGYLANPQASADSLRDGWFYTGDMARQDDEGYFYIVGRLKDMIISGGENIYAAEVEAVLQTHPAVADCALIGRPDPKWGEVGLMVTVLAAGQTTTADDLLAFCRQRLARYKVPKAIVFANSLPYSPYGKVQKVKLRQQLLTESH